MGNRIEGSLYVDGEFAARTMNIPASAVDNAAVEAAAGIEAEKLEHQHRARFSNESATTAVSGSWPIHVVHGATSTLVKFMAGSVVANIGAATITVDLKKNG